MEREPRAGMRLKHWRHLVEIVALVAAGVWGFYVFIYEERLKPLHQSASIVITPTATVSNAGKYQIVSIRIHLENPGSAPVDIAGEEVTVHGELLGQPGQHKDRNIPNWDIQPGYFFRPGPVLLSQGRLREGAIGGTGGSHIFLRSHEVASVDASVIVRRHQFIALMVDYTLVPGKAPIEKVDLRPERDAEGAIHITKGGQDNGYILVPLP